MAQDASGTAPTPASGEMWSPAVEPEQAAGAMTAVTPPVAPRRPNERASRTADPQDPNAREGEADAPVAAANPNAVPIGRWGERFVLTRLRDEVAARHPEAVVERTGEGFRLTEGGSVVAQVRWLNHDRDVGVGCDIQVIDGATEWVEVKSTADGRRTAFDMTQPQWDAAREQGPAYRIVRVYYAGMPQARAEDYRDPYRLWQEGRLAARPIRIVI